MKTTFLSIALLLCTALIGQETPPPETVTPEQLEEFEAQFSEMFGSALTIDLGPSFEKSILNMYIDEDRKAMVNMMKVPETFEIIKANFDKEQMDDPRLKMTGKDTFTVNGEEVLMQEGETTEEVEGEIYITQIYAKAYQGQSVMVTAVFPRSQSAAMSGIMRQAIGTVTE